MTMNWKGKLLIKHIKMFCAVVPYLLQFDNWISVPANHLLSQRIEGVQKKEAGETRTFAMTRIAKGTFSFLSYLM